MTSPFLLCRTPKWRVNVVNQRTATLGYSSAGADQLVPLPNAINASEGGAKIGYTAPVTAASGAGHRAWTCHARPSRCDMYLTPQFHDEQCVVGHVLRLRSHVDRSRTGRAPTPRSSSSHPADVRRCIFRLTGKARHAHTVTGDPRKLASLDRVRCATVQKGLQDRSVRIAVQTLGGGFDATHRIAFRGGRQHRGAGVIHPRVWAAPWYGTPHRTPRCNPRGNGRSPFHDCGPFGVSGLSIPVHLVQPLL